MLDCLRFFKNIPDEMPDASCQRLLYLFKGLKTTHTKKEI